MRNPDNDQNYLSLALIIPARGMMFRPRKDACCGQSRFRARANFTGARPSSALQGNTSEAASQSERAVDLLPEWSGGYSTLGVFYFQTRKNRQGQRVLNRFKESSANSSLEISTLSRSSTGPLRQLRRVPHALANKEQFFQLALSLADRTL